MGAHSELLPVVGIGASAGGLAALKKLFGYMPADTGMAFVVVIHLSPEHESHLADLLQAHSAMPVTQVTGTMEMRPDHIYVIPPGANLTAVDTHLRLSKLEKQRGQRAPIDHFFGTLAETHHQTAVGVILTGTGSDGTSGLRRIREMGGLAIVQDPGEAEYDSMPRSAIDKGIVDLVLPLSEMPAYIVRFATTQPDVPVPEGDGDIERDERQTLVNILTQVRARTGHDFTRYKPATVMRRIRRRMQIHEIEELEQYAERIRPDRVEAQHLFDDLLITVTNFFRDQGTFEALERHIIPQLMSGKGDGDRIRAWSVGCATGEEAYSLAMLLMEQAAQMDCTPEIQVFATDIHQASLQSAREGLYPVTIESDVTPERLRRFFVRENDHYRIRAEVRERIVFAPHNLMKDPPFSQLDLISCRNLLIYLQREVQQGIFRLFHYALRPGRYLLLGSSETVERSELFDRVDEAHCIYRRRDIPAREARLPIFPVPAARLARQDPDLPRRPEGVPGYGALHQKMVHLYAPPSLLVNEDDAIVHSSARAGRYLEVPGGEPTNNVFRLVREPLRLELRSGLSAARDRGEAYRSRPIRLEGEGGQVHVMVRVQPAEDDGELSQLYLVIFDEVPAPKPVERGSDAATEGTVRELEAEGTVRELQEELAATRARLQAGIEEHGSSQEEMQASNEELQSMNEELRSTMEELETSKEELQSINEELATVNQENRHKVEELGQLSSDLQNLFSATDIATLFLDRQLRIMRFTPPLGELFNVRSTDRGRPISDLTHHLGAIALEKDTQEVLDSLVPVTREVRSQEGRWYLSRILPYRSTEDRIDGVVITFVDITERRDAEAAVRQSEARFRALVNASAYSVYRMSPDWSEMRRLDGGGFIADIRQPTKEWLDEYIYPDDQPQVRAAIQEAIRTNSTFELEHRVRRVDGTLGWTLSRAVPLLDDEGEVVEWFGAASDITERKEAEDALRKSEEKYRTLFDSIDEGFCTTEILFDEKGKPFDYRFLEANPAFVRQTGLEDAIGRTVRELAPEHEEFWFEIYGRIAKTGEPRRFEHEARAIGFFYDVYAFPIGEAAENRVAILFNDISERKKAEEALRESEERQAFLLELSDALRPLSDPVAVQAAAVEMLGRHLGAVRAQYWEAEAHGEHLISHGGYFNGMPPINGLARMDEFGAHVQEALTFGQTLSVADAAADPQAGVEERAAYEAFGFRAYVAVPLVKDGQLVATLGAYHADVHEWTNQEIGLIEATAERTWAAVERARAEETLSESEERFRTVSNLVPDLLWRSDPTGSTTWYNQRWMEYTGQTLEEALGWGWMDVIHPDDREQTEKNYRRATEEAESLEQAHRIRRHDGEYRWFLVRAEPLLDAEREVRHFFGSATDVHDQRTTLEELEERVQERTHEVRELARTLTMAEQEERRRIARILHDDLQQLLFGVQLRLDHLAGDIGEPPRPKLKKDLQEARDWIGSAIAHTRELSLELSPPVLKEEGLAKALGWLAGQMWEKHQFKVDLRAEEGTRINDEDARSLLFQTVRELLFNVLKHAGVREAAAAMWAEDEHIHLEISDAGSGFNLEALQAPPGPQTGLGLCSARERIGLIGGTLEIDTAPGEGTRISITAPMHTTRRSQT